MILNVVTLLLVLAITFMHSIFGFFSGLINVFCTVTSLVIALGFGERLNEFVTGSFGLSPSYSGPVCIVGLFVVSLIVLRTLADNYIRGNVRIPAALDMGGAAVCGFINAQIIVGVAVLGLMMLPLRSSEKSTVMQFARWSRITEERNPDNSFLPKFERNSLWTRSDEFSVGLFNILSNGSLHGDTSFSSVYPNYTDAIFFSANTVQPESSPAAGRDKKYGDGFKNGLRVEQWWEQPGPLEGRYREGVPTGRERRRVQFKRQSYQVRPGHKLIGMKLTLGKAAADIDKRSAVHMFRPTMIRLVGKRSNGPAQYVPCALANTDKAINGGIRIVDYDNNFRLPGNGDAVVYAYFEVDEDFQPAFVEYRRYARAAVPEKTEKQPELQITLGQEGASGGRGTGGGSGKGLTFGRILESKSGDNPKLPFPMLLNSLRRAGDVTLKGGRLVSGRIFGSRSRLERASGNNDPVVEEFEIPEGRRILQIRYKPKRARSLAGQVFNFVGQLNQYVLEDNNANPYPLAGYYAIVKRNRDEYVELFFNGDPKNPMDPGYKNMLDFKELQRNEINDQDDTIISLIFVVPKDTEFVRVRNQSGKGGDILLRSRR